MGASPGYATLAYAAGPAEPPKPLERAGTTFGEFVGWRIWHLKSGFLTSYSASYVWTPGQAAEGKVDDYGGGGIWAFKEPNCALHKAVTEAGPQQPFVFGSVELYGEVIEHSDGYRGEYAAVRSIENLVFGENRSQTFRERWRERRERERELPAMLAELRERYGITEAPA